MQTYMQGTPSHLRGSFGPYALSLLHTRYFQAAVATFATLIGTMTIASRLVLVNADILDLTGDRLDNLGYCLCMRDLNISDDDVDVNAAYRELKQAYDDLRKVPVSHWFCVSTLFQAGTHFSF